MQLVVLSTEVRRMFLIEAEGIETLVMTEILLAARGMGRERTKWCRRFGWLETGARGEQRRVLRKRRSPKTVKRRMSRKRKPESQEEKGQITLSLRKELLRNVPA